MTIFRHFLAITALLIVEIVSIGAQDFLGCGGFVKSDVDINFSLVEVKLYTKQGSLKYQTDCAPNNGYFLIPIYDKGDFVLKVEPPAGWSFEPSSVDLTIDGKTDKCSKGEDINFQFTGFSIVGRVISKGKNEGPKGVTVALQKKNQDGVIQQVSTETGGRYTFSPVLPGDYIVTASHALWTFESATAKYTVTKENGNLGDKLVVSGYDVSGEVRSEGEPIQGVAFLLFSKTSQKQDIQGCDFTAVKGFHSTDQNSLLCNVESDKNGKFVFPSLPSGDYWVVPFYKGEHITFDVVPDKLTFTVAFDSVKLQPVFQVEGFSVTGRVVDSPKGSPLAGVSIKLDGKPQTQSVADGTYRLDKITSGSYVVEAIKDNIFFDAMTVKITPNTPQLPDIVASSFNLCGKVSIEKLPESVPVAAERHVTLTPDGAAAKDTVNLPTKSDGSYCFPVKPGKYNVQVVVSDDEVKAGVKLIPSKHSVTITNKPVTGIDFTQFKAVISGHIKCLDVCGTLSISLASQDRSEEARLIEISQGTRQASFIAQNVLPGKYTATIIKEDWCWNKKSVEITVVDSDISGIEFTQSGYVMKATTTHSVALHYIHASNSKNSGIFEMEKGYTQVCLSQAGLYKLRPKSCHKFEQEEYTYETTSTDIVTLTAVKHLMTGTIVTKDKAKDLTLTIQSAIETEPVTTLGPLKSVQEIEREEKLKQLQSQSQKEKSKDKPKEPQLEELKGPFTYEYTYWARSAEKITITPSSEELLFYPASQEVLVQSDTCPTVIASFEGRLGLFLVGSVEPAIAEVDITITPQLIDEYNKDVINTQTDDKGMYRVGPLHDHTQYSVMAKKEGYIMTQLEGKAGSFKAFKLGEIIIEVIDEEEGPLQGVLLSLSGGSFRSNNLTQSNGTMHFSNLKPGQYFLRPMMKEYRFEPNSQMIDVLEGSTVKLQIKGLRVAFSCYGRITSLNGEAEPGVAIQASGTDNCGEILEETVSDQDGTFRMRGLQPQCTYELKVKIGEENSHLERSAPVSKMIKVENQDISNIRIIVFRKFNQFEIGGNVITAVEYLPSLKVLLYSEDNLDAALHTLSLSNTNFFQFPTLPMDGKKYLIKLDSTLAKSSFDYSLPEVSFTTNGYHKHVTMKFEPQRRSLDQDLAQGSYIALPLIILAIFVAFNHDKVLPYIQQLTHSVKTYNTGSISTKQTIDREQLSSDEITKHKKKAKTRKT
ncbi:BOS complex subunit NOMO1-like [Ptychodera flava]|uniref:BOS complex subunit NOMO1-like n=1 Tax=Ptychodera flava TaxID=63121 RepID=UPI00396A4812